MSWIKNSLPKLLLVLFWLALLELGCWAIWNFATSERHPGAAAIRQALSGEVNRFNTILSHPYSLYWNNPDFEDAEFGPQYNALGHRSGPVPEDDDSFVVLALGGSTTNAYPYVRDRNLIWTALLEDHLEGYLNREVTVLNAGLPYGTTAELMVHFLMTGKYLNPDLVIYHGGGNDGMPLMFPGYRTDYSHVRAAAKARPPSKALVTLLRVSHTVRVIAAQVMDGSVYQAQPFGFEALDPAETLERVRTTEPVAFESNLSIITREAMHLGADVLLVGFLQAKKENLATNRTDIAGLEEAILLASDKNEAVMRKVAAENGQTFLRLDQDRFQDDWFLDNTHLTKEGEAEKARQIFESLKPVL
ncbi:MAG: SGNH/GDSL hydrolase family protein [Paracoccaceae bacterium]